MTYSFNDALRTLVHSYSTAVENVRQRVLPTPGKRKRAEEEGIARPDENQLPKQRIVEVQKRGASSRAINNAESKDGTPALHIKSPATGRDYDGMEEDLNTPQGAMRPFKLLPGLSAYGSGVSAGASGRDTGTGQWGISPATYGRRKLLSRVADVYHRKTGAAKFLWQRKYPHWDTPSPNKSIASALDLQSDVFSLRGGGRKTGGGKAENTTWGASQLGRVGASEKAGKQLALQSEHQQPMEPGLPALQRDTERPAAREPLAAGPLAHLRKDARPSQQSAWQLASTRASEGADLAVARYELERIHLQRASEQRKAESERLLASCSHLMGDRQALLMARTRAALREEPSGPSQAAEFSRLSMELARREAALLMGSLSEEDLLEAQHRRLSQARQARLVQPEALSAAQPTALEAPKVAHSKHKAAAKAPAGDVIDLLSSSDEEEAHTRVGEEGSAAESQTEEEGEEEEEEEDEEETEAQIAARLRAIGVRDERHPPQYPPLSKRQRLLYADAMNERADQEAELKLHRGTFIAISRSILACLKPRTWLNDEVVNLFMGLLQERDKAWRPHGKYPKCHFFNTFFFNKLYMDKRRYSYDEVRRWTKPNKLATAGQASRTVVDCDRIIAPVHLPAHWVCAVADLQKRELLFLDSMGSRPKGLMESFRRYVVDEFKDKKQVDVDAADWPIRYPHVPQQENGSDCGVFAVMFAEYMSRNAPLEFTQADMPYFRVMVTAALMDLQAPAHFE